MFLPHMWDDDWDPDIISEQTANPYLLADIYVCSSSKELMSANMSAKWLVKLLEWEERVQS